MNIIVEPPQRVYRGLGLRVATETTAGWPGRNKRRWDIELAEGNTGTAALFEHGQPLRDHMHILVIRDGNLFVDGVSVVLAPDHKLADGIRLSSPRFGGK